MENQPPTSNASAWLSRKPASPDAEDGRAEVARLKERLSFYESFDSLIQESVSRAGELLRHAAATRENAEQQLAESRREMLELRNGDRQEYRSLLSGLLDDVTTMQVQIERLARRVADALDDLEVSLPAGAGAGYLAASTLPLPEVESAPPLPIEPTMDELLPPEPPGEAEHGAPPFEPPHEVEAEVVAAEARIETPVLEAEPAEFDAAGEAVPVEPDTSMIVDEIVQEPAGDEAEPDDDHDADDEGLGDGVVSDGLGAASHEPVAPAAPAEENAVETVEGHTAPPPAAESGEEPAPAKLPWIAADVRPFSVEGLSGAGIRRPGTGELRMPQPAARTSVSTSTLVAPEGVATAVLVHGVPRATTALSLKRYLEGLTHVAAVEPREYAEGVLRLHVTGQRTLNLDDLRGWSDGAQLEPVHLRDDLIEVRLPS